MNCSSRPITLMCWRSTTSHAFDRGCLTRFAGWQAVGRLRQLYTDHDEVLFDAARPVILNSIEEVITRPDLGDRSIFLTLTSIAAARRRSEHDLWQRFELARPGILGGLLDLVAHGLRRLPALSLDRMPRMADFAFWTAACETACWPAGTFIRSYEANRRSAIESMVDADPVAACVREMMTRRGSWSGTADELLRAGAGRTPHGISRDSSGWPRNPRALAGRLRRAQTFLRELEIEIVFSREGHAGRRIISIHTNSECTVRTVSNVVEHGPGVITTLATGS